MTIQPVFFPLSTQILFDSNACPTRYGSVLFFDAETTSPRTVYKDAKLTTAHPTPVKTDFFGRIPAIWVGVGDYKAVLQDAVGAQLAVIDDMPGGEDVTPPTPAEVPIQTGMVIPAHTNDAFDGWLPLNGTTFGNASSGGTARANDDCAALYIKLWNQDASLTVAPGGRGQTASADFAAAKTLSLPDYRGRFFCGVDQMGAPATAGIVTAVSLPAGASPDAIGTAFGAETVTLAQTHLPAFAPTITIDGGSAGGAHPHAGTTDSQGSHNHNGSTGAAGAHNHPYVQTQNDNSGYGPGSQLGNNGAFAANTSAVADHIHVIGTDGVHSHNVTITSSGAHLHTAVSSKLGSGTAHPNMPPAILGSWLIKL